MNANVPIENAVSTWSASSVASRPTQVASRNAYGPAPSEGQALEGMGIDFVRLLRVIRKHRLVIAGIVAFALVVGFASTLMMRPMYRSDVLIETSADQVRVATDQNQEPQANAAQQAAELATFVELVNSRSLAQRVVEDLHLADDPTFLGTGSLSLFQRAKRMIFGANDDPAANSLEARQKAAVTRILDNTSAKAVKSSRLMSISYVDANPARAQAIADALSTGFIKASLGRRFDASTYARLFLQDQLAQVKLKLEDSERKAVAYADKERLVSLDNQKSILSENLEDLNTALSKAAVDRANAEQLWLKAKDAKDYAEIPNVDATPQNGDSSQSIINKLRSQKSDLMADYRSKLLTFKPGFPVMVALQAQIDDVDRQIADEVEKTKLSIRTAYELAVQREKALADAVDESRGALIDMQNRSVEYTTLKREADTNRTLYDGLLQRFKEISVFGGVASTGLSIVDSASLPTAPYSPRLSINLAVALFAGLLLGVGAALALEHFDNTVKSPDQLEVTLGIPVLGLIPIFPTDQSVSAVLDDPHSAVIEAYRSARTALQFSTDRGVPKNFVVTSARPSEGKTTSATTLARLFAQVGMRVLLIDADLRNPSLHKIFDADNQVGLSNFLTGSHKADAVQQPSNYQNVTLILSGPIPPNPAELLSSPKMLTLLTELRDAFDIIIVDSAPVMGLADALLLSSIADGTLIVCAAGETPMDTVKTATKRLMMTNCQILGGILTKFSAQKSGYGYAYYGYDYYGYGRDDPKQLPSA